MEKRLAKELPHTIAPSRLVPERLNQPRHEKHLLVSPCRLRICSVAPLIAMAWVSSSFICPTSTAPIDLIDYGFASNLCLTTEYCTGSADTHEHEHMFAEKGCRTCTPIPSTLVPYHLHVQLLSSHWASISLHLRFIMSLSDQCNCCLA